MFGIGGALDDFLRSPLRPRERLLCGEKRLATYDHIAMSWTESDEGEDGRDGEKTKRDSKMWSSWRGCRGGTGDAWTKQSGQG